MVKNLKQMSCCSLLLEGLAEGGVVDGLGVLLLTEESRQQMLLLKVLRIL